MCQCTPQKRTPFCGAPGCEWPAQVIAAEHEEDEAHDRERNGGPITDGMLHTALNTCKYDVVGNPRDLFDLTALARIVNSWLKPVSS